MNEIGWTLYVLAFVALVVIIRVRRSGQVSKKEAAELVKNGAIIVDVRNPDEFQRGHLSQAYNMPLNNIESSMMEKFKDREKPVLLHCQSGFRSARAKGMLERKGYKHVYNLGSYERAFKIVSGRNL
ncbi:MAG: rhodanese-like domain-containing protein [Terracidiphilus sp.]|nr:rhodanese-like domain-containing protein [Terracidiphilus sp.]